MKNLRLLAAVLFMMLVIGTTADAEILRVSSFSELMVHQNHEVHSYINYNTQVIDNLMVRNSEGVDSIATGKWSMGFVTSLGLIGYADTGTYLDFGQTGYLAGFYDAVLGDGNSPSGLFLVYDSTGNGWDIVGTQVGSTRDLLDGDKFYTGQDILFGPSGLRGALGIALLPSYIENNGGAAAILPHMVVDPIPEYSTIDDLLILCEYWLEDCSSLNCEGADDWNPDGKVDFLDFAELASRW